MLQLRPMVIDDLPQIDAWLREPHVSRWFLQDSTLEQTLEKCRNGIDGVEPTHLLVVLEDEVAIGWCQWYRCSDHPDYEVGVGAATSDIGIDYAIGKPSAIGRGLGTQLITELVRWVREVHPGAGVIADPEAANVPSRRILEKNEFQLIDVRPVASEPSTKPMAIYRLP